MKWNLDKLFKGFDDPKYISYTQEIAETIKEINGLSLEISTIDNYLLLQEKLYELVEPYINYIQLRSSTNVNDIDALNEFGKIQIVLQDLIEKEVEFKQFIGNVDIEALDSEVCKRNMFYLSKQKDEALHSLSKTEEVLYSKLKMVSSNSWSDLQSKLTANLSVEVKGFDKPMNLSSARNLAYSNSSEERYNAYIGELESYKKIEDSVAMALNNIKREVNIIMPLKGYSSALEATVSQSNMTVDTLNSLIEAINEKLPSFRKYFKLKAKALGYTNGLPFYELFAPMGCLTKTYSVDEAKEEVLSVYKSFSDKMYNMAYKAFNENWIDLYPYEGKIGGAFCANITAIKESRVLANFTGSLSDVQTLAHELGHAYHGDVVCENSPLNRDYPMPLAETASILAQTIMTNKMISEYDDVDSKLTILENSLQEDTQCLVDILSRYNFETKVLSKDISTILSSKDMCDLMLEAQEETYGDGLDSNYKHPYMWLCKGHYYSSGLNFYNWPYAFGTLYAKGLFNLYKKNKEEFVSKYDKMLAATAMASVEDCAKIMGIDVTKKDFWLASISEIEKDIEEYEEILKMKGLI